MGQFENVEIDAKNSIASKKEFVGTDTLKVVKIQQKLRQVSRTDKYEIHKKNDNKGDTKLREKLPVIKTNDLFSNGSFFSQKEVGTSIQNKSLHCYYKYGPHSYLNLARFKTEQLHLDPDVVMYHDVVSDEDIEVLKRLAKPQFEAGTVNVGVKVYRYRVIQVAWLRDWSSEVVSRITRRVALMTGLSMRKAEPLQVGNYGIGGFYAPHFDCKHVLDSNNVEKMVKGNRVATVLFYLSDVDLGGATMFLRLGLSVFPKKRAAISWSNVLPYGELDERTAHAANPVLRGYKWTATKWISV